MQKLILVANPGSASRKYALYEGDKLCAQIHFEYEKNDIIYTVIVPGKTAITKKADLSHLTFSATKLVAILHEYSIIHPDDEIDVIGLRIVAPSTYFQEHRRIDARVLKKLHDLQPRAPLHISASLQEAELLKSSFPRVPVVGASDSVFHLTKPMVTHSYGISQKDARDMDIWRFSYHGLSLSSITHQLKDQELLSARTVVCHLGSGSSVTALLHGKSMDNTMGYSPLEGLLMSTRSGSIDPTAVEVLRTCKKLTRDGIQNYLNLQSGLKGVSGKSDDIRELLELETKGSEPAALALSMYVLRVQQAIGYMVATLGGVDTLVFTGTVGERSAEIRKRVCANLTYLNVHLSHDVNNKTIAPSSITKINVSIAEKKILVVPCDEAVVIAKIASTFS